MVAIVVGGADGALDEWRDARRAMGGALTVAVNNAGCHLPCPVDHWATLHPQEMVSRALKRWRAGHPPAGTYWTAPQAYGVTHATEFRELSGWSGGSSGLFGLGVALQYAGGAILCGIPMDGRPHFDRVSGWEDSDSYWPAWLALPDDVRRRVRSMSGRTRDLFGAPSRRWAAELHRAGPSVRPDAPKEIIP